MKNRYNEIIKTLSEKELILNLYVTQILLIGISFVLAIIFFENWSDFFQLFNWGDPAVLVLGGSAGLAVVIIDLLLMKMLPNHYYDDGGINKRIFQNRSVLHIVFISAIVAFCEEVLFRGIIQTHFGLVVSSAIFALIHFRYLFSWFLFLNVILLSFIIGYIYMITVNLSITIFMHFLIDCLLGLTIRFKHYKIERNGRDIHE